MSFPQLLSALPETSEQTFTVSFVPWAPRGPVMHTYIARAENLKTNQMSTEEHNVDNVGFCRAVLFSAALTRVSG